MARSPHFAALVLAGLLCGPEAAGQAPLAPPPSGLSLVTDFCDEPVYAAGRWTERTRGPLRFRVLEGSLADRNLEALAASRRTAYERIARFFELDERPEVTVVVSPNRLAATRHGYGVGRARVEARQVEVLYLGGEDSYERHHFGHELAHVLGAEVDGRTARLPLLDEGLAEYLDGSGRALHRAYADALAGGKERPGFDDGDVWGKNYGRAGSLVAFLIESRGRARFLDLWRAAAVTRVEGGFVTTGGAAVRDASTLRGALDVLVREVYETSLSALLVEWEAALAPYLEAEPSRLAAADLEAIEEVVRVMDDAVARRDPRAYRSTLEGFYCDVWNDASRARLAEEAVEAASTAATEILSVHPVGRRNYSEAIVHVARVAEGTGGGAPRHAQYWMERFPAGWRVTWSTAW